MKPKQKELSSFEKKQQQHDKIFKKLSFGNVLLVILGFLFSWKCGVALIGLSLYCWYWFEEGYRSQCVDEWEIGYFRDAKRYLLKGLLWLAMIVIAGYFLFLLVK